MNSTLDCGKNDSGSTWKFQGAEAPGGTGDEERGRQGEEVRSPCPPVSLSPCPFTERPRRVLIVCTGNVCRSPMATGLLRQRLAEDGLDAAVEVRSAGMWGLDGEPASAHAVQVMAERGVDIGDHRARTLRQHDIAAADLILTMEEQHRRSIFYIQPAALSKVFLLSEMAGEHGDVDDPYGLPIEAYRASADVLTRLISQGYEEIRRRLDLSISPPAQRST